MPGPELEMRGYYFFVRRLKKLMRFIGSLEFESAENALALAEYGNFHNYP